MLTQHMPWSSTVLSQVVMSAKSLSVCETGVIAEVSNAWFSAVLQAPIFRRVACHVSMSVIRLHNILMQLKSAVQTNPQSCDLPTTQLS